MITKRESDTIVEEVAGVLKKHFTPAFEILQQEKEKIRKEFDKVAWVINENDEKMKDLEKRIIILEKK